MSDLERPERLQIMMSAEEIRALDDWRFARRMPSRAAAIRELLRLGLEHEGVGLATAGKHSTQFGVLDHAQAKRNGSGEGASRSARADAVIE
jgi:hypothetical protein